MTPLINPHPNNLDPKPTPSKYVESVLVNSNTQLSWERFCFTDIPTKDKDVNMSSDEDEEVEEGLSLGGLPPRPPRPRQKTLLGKLTIGRRKSTGQEFLHSKHLPTESPAIADPVPQQSTRVSRSQSNANVHGFKLQWADALICQ